MVLSIIGSILTVLAIALPEILKWMEQNATVKNAANLALTRLSVSSLRRIRERLRPVADKGEAPLPPQ